jgi:hypothetical protein
VSREQLEAFDFSELSKIGDRDVDGGAASKKRPCAKDARGRHRPCGQRRKETETSVEVLCGQCDLWFQVDRNPSRWRELAGGS